MKSNSDCNQKSAEQRRLRVIEDIDSNDSVAELRSDGEGEGDQGNLEKGYYEGDVTVMASS